MHKYYHNLYHFSYLWSTKDNHLETGYKEAWDNGNPNSWCKLKGWFELTALSMWEIEDETKSESFKTQK